MAQACSSRLVTLLYQLQYTDASMALSEKYGEIPKDLSRSIQVIGAGYSRTGTVSLSLALEKLLRGPVCHSGSACILREEGMANPYVSDIFYICVSTS